MFWNNKAWGNITSATYQEHVLSTLSNFYDTLHHTSPPDFSEVVMKDNDLPHKAKTTLAWPENEGVPLLEWPVSSADLNPIENVGSLTKERMQRRHPRPVTLEAIREAVQEEWDAILVGGGRSIYL